MRSIIVNYLNRRSSVHLPAETKPTTNETSKNEEKLKENQNDQDAATVEMFNDIKYIDDNETDSASMLSSSSCCDEPTHLMAYQNIPSASVQNEPNHLNQIIKSMYNRMSDQNEQVIKTQSTDAESTSSRYTRLNEENRLLKEKIGQLEEKLKSTSQLREAIEIMRLDRKRLKCEKLELLNQTRDLYKTIESKENELKEILSHFELKSRETSLIVKRLLDSKLELEEEKNKYYVQTLELSNDKSQLNLMLESKNAIINNLNKEIFELKSRLASPNHSSDKESDYGYSSSKSHDTLSTSIQHCDTIINKPAVSSSSSTNTSTSPIRMIKSLSISKYSTITRASKEERQVKCKSNADAYFYVKNNTSATSSKSVVAQKNPKSTKLISKEKIRPKNSNFSDSEEYNRGNNNQLSVSFKEMEEETTTTCSSSTSFSTPQQTNSSLLNNNAQNLSPSSSITSYTNEASSSKNHNQSEDESSTSSSFVQLNSSGSGPNKAILSQSVTICCDNPENSDDLDDSRQYEKHQVRSNGVKQSMSMSMNMNTSVMQQPSMTKTKSRSSRLINSIIRMSTIGTSALSFNNANNNNMNRSSTIDSTLSSKLSDVDQVNQDQFARMMSSSTLSHRHHHQPDSTSFKMITISAKNSKSHQNLFSSLESASMSSSVTTERKMINLNNAIISEEEETSQIGFYCCVEKWDQKRMESWLESVGMLPEQIRCSQRMIFTGKMLLNMSDADLERAFMLTNQLHRRKLRLAIDDLRHQDRCKYPQIGQITTDFICNVWLREIGLVQYQSQFRHGLVDGRVLSTLNRRDLEKYLRMSKKSHQTSLLSAVDLLRRFNFDINKIKELRASQMKEFKQMDAQLWTNDCFVDWFNLVSLNRYSSLLPQSGLHGGLVVDSSFNVELLLSLLDIKSDQFSNEFNHKKILEDEIKILKKFKSNSKPDRAFARTLASFRQDRKSFTFRGSLGRALGKKIKREISSPLIDDETLKRIEYKHKIVDMKNLSLNGPLIDV